MKEKGKKFYIVFSRKEDNFWTRFKRAAVNARPCEGFDTREEALAELHKTEYPSWYRYRIVEVLEKGLHIEFKRVEKVVWR